MLEAIEEKGMVDDANCRSGLSDTYGIVLIVYERWKRTVTRCI